MTGQSNPDLPDDTTPDLTRAPATPGGKASVFTTIFKPSPKVKVQKTPAPPRTTLSKPAGKRPLKEPGKPVREVKPGVSMAGMAQNKKLLGMVGAFLLLGSVSLYVNFAGGSPEKPVTAFVMPGPGQPGYIPAPGTMNTNTTGSAVPGAASSNTAGFTTPAQTTTSGAAGTPPAIPGTTPTSAANPSGVVISTSAPPSATSASATTPGNTTKTAKGSAKPAGTTTKPAQVAKASKGTPAAAIPGAPGSKAAPTDVLSEPVIPDVFAVAEDKNAGGAGGTGPSGNGNASGSAYRAGNGNAQGAPSGVNMTAAYAAPAALRNVPLAPVPRQVQVAAAVPMSIQSLPAPAPVAQVRSVPTLSAMPVALPRSVQMTPVPQPVVLPLQSPVTARTSTGVTLTPGTPAATPAAAPSVVLVGTASGDTPTAILATPAGQMIAGIGDHVTVNDVDYTVSKINATSVTMTHLKDTLTLTETN